MKQALQPLVALLLTQLTKQEEGQDLDESVWNVSMAAGTCLSFVAQTVGDDVVALSMPYVQVLCLSDRAVPRHEPCLQNFNCRELLFSLFKGTALSDCTDLTPSTLVADTSHSQLLGMQIISSRKYRTVFLRSMHCIGISSALTTAALHAE